MECPHCHTPLADVVHYCHRCGHDLRSADEKRDHHFALKPDEPVASFAIVSSIMPRGSAQRPQTYRLVLLVGLVAALLAACFGAVSVAVLVAAFAIPVVYIVYLYDVNLWDDHPVQVTVMAFVLSFVLAVGFTLLWWRGISPSAPPTGRAADLSAPGPELTSILVLVLLVPIVGELLRQIGPIFLASRPRFDDLLDGAAFGVVSGVAFATADTLVRHWALISGGFTREIDPGLWMSLIFLEGFVKPLVIGTASGIAAAEFSGLGRGYDGFSGRYARGFAEAVLANALYFGGVYLLSFVGSDTVSVLLSVVWGGLILGVLVIRMRRILHIALLEAALESAQTEAGGPTDADEQEFCHQCEMPLFLGSSFCSACGVSLRTRAKKHHPPASPGSGPAPSEPAESASTGARTGEGS